MLMGLLVFFLALGLAQALLAGRVVDAIHGGAGKRGPRGRSLDVLILRSAGVFVALVAAVVLIVLWLSGSEMV